MLPSIDLFLRIYEKIDRMIAASLGLVLDYRRALKEMGESHFFYIVTITLNWPRQILLGNWPNPSALRRWMMKVRQSLFESASQDAKAGDIVINWNNWARAEGLADALVYTAPSARNVKPLLEDLSRVFVILGGENSITLDQTD